MATYDFGSLESKRLELIHVRPLQSCNGNLISGLCPRDTLALLLLRARSPRINLCPVYRCIFKTTLAGCVMLRDLGVLGVIGLGRAQQALKGDQRGLKCEDGRPCIFEDVETYGARCGGDVRMVDLSYELHLDRLEWVRFGDDNVLTGGAFDSQLLHVDHPRWNFGLTTSKCPPWYGVPSGPGKDPFRWKGDSSIRSILIFEVLSFLQSS